MHSAHRPAFLGLAAAVAVAASLPRPTLAQEVVDHTFSLVARDPATGELGAAVTTRNACVGNGVPWLRVGVGAVATQAATRTAYADEIFSRLEAGMPADEALVDALAEDPAAERRQLGVIAADGSIGQHTGTGNGAWAGQRTGSDWATQGNVLVGPEVLDAVTATMAASAGSGRHLADRMIEAMEAGQAAGGDRRSGRRQSAAVMVVDPREGRARRADGQTVNIHVCEHPTPVAELRRIHDTVSQTLGYRRLERPAGNDVAQLQLLLHALGHWRPGTERPTRRTAGWGVFDAETVAAVDAFRSAAGLPTPEDGSPAGLVDAATVDALWSALEAEGRAEELRAALRQLTAIRR